VRDGEDERAGPKGDHGRSRGEGSRTLIPCDDITFQPMDVAEHRINLLTVTDGGVSGRSRSGRTTSSPSCSGRSSGRTTAVQVR
jgi:hypothetical protein